MIRLEVRMRFSKAVLGLAAVLLSVTIGLSAGQDEDSRAALLIIDIQQFYYPGGAGSLVEPEAASRNASKILSAFRSRGDLVVHVRHKASKGAEIHEHVAPIEGEEVFTKSEVSCFNGTGLLAYLQKEKVSKLVIAGMMTHMCVEAAVRAAYDLGFEVTLIGDACATRDLEFGGAKIAAADVHASTLATLARTYAQVLTTKEYLATAQAPSGAPPE
jgi:nicotinamidase-related amidase